jgi:hypothetical protein
VIGAVVVLACGLACAVGTMLLVRDASGGSLAGSSLVGVLLLVAAGALAIAVGLAQFKRRRGNPFGLLLICGGFAWFFAEWNNPGVESSVVFTLGLVFYASCPPIVAHAALAYPNGRLGSAAERIAVTIAYIGSLLVLGVGPVLFFDPETQGCAQCAANRVVVSSNADFVATLDRFGVRIGVAWALAITCLMMWRLVRSGPAIRRATAAVLLPGVAYMGAVTATYIHSRARGTLSNDDVDRRLWTVQAVCFILVSLGVVTEWLRARRARASVAEMVVRLAEAPPPGGLRAALATNLGDPDLEIGYPIGDGTYVDADANPIAIEPGRGRATTALVHAGETIALLIHRNDLLGDARLVERVASAARLAFEHERLHARAQAEFVELRASRARLVAASDDARRMLERDLHDGAQQHLVGLTFALRMMRTRLERSGSAIPAARVAEAETELRGAVDELRRLASGIHPAVLTDYGLTAAIQALAETSSTAVRLDASVERRYSSAVETAAYMIVSAAAMAGPARVSIVRRGNRLVVDATAARQPEHLVDIEDRLGALDGAMRTEHTDNGVRILAEIPCE